MSRINIHNTIIFTITLALLSSSAAHTAYAFGGRPDDDKSKVITVPSNQEADAPYYRGDLDKSIELYRVILENFPDNRSARYSLSLILMEKGMHKEAYKIMSEDKSGRAGISSLSFESGAVWEDPDLSVFLSGDYTRYLNSILIESSIAVKHDSVSEETRSTILSEKLFFRGLSHSYSGNPQRAVQSLEEALKIRSYFPAANMMLGIIHHYEGRHSNAVKHLELALRQDNNLTRARPYLARSILEEGRLNEGYASLKRALATRPWDKQSADLLALLEAENPHLTAAAETAARTRRLTAAAPIAYHFTESPEVMPLVRIGLGENLGSIYLKTGGHHKITSPRGQSVTEGGKDLIYRITSSGGIIRIFKENGEKIAESRETLSLSSSTQESTTILFDISYSVGYQSAGQEDRAYRGNLSFMPRGASGMTVVNTLPLEEYLYSVIPSEMPSWWPDEALSAQAVAARSYTLANMGRFNSRGFDLLGSIESAFYRGYTGEKESTNAAVDRTRGLVLKNNGKYLSAYYSANSAGRTESAASVWRMNAPFIGVTDPPLQFGSNPPAPDELARWILSEPFSYSNIEGNYYRSAYRWRLIVPREEIEARIGTDIGTISSITTSGRGDSGRVEEVTIKGTKQEIKIAGDRIRSRLGGLRSNLFIVLPKFSAGGESEGGEIESFFFAGAGWGHGVGMCQSGASGMASIGFNAQEILNHYYPLAQIVKEY